MKDWWIVQRFTGPVKRSFRKLYCYLKYGNAPIFIKGEEHWNLGQHLSGRCGCGRHKA